MTSPTPDLEAELVNYRAHRFAITRLEDGDFALFDPAGDLLAIGTLADLAPLVLTGPDHYETCALAWRHRPRRSDTTAGTELLAKLGLARPTPAISTPLLRRI